MHMIAENFNDFVTKVEEAERTALNTPAGQELTKNLLKEMLKKNPHMTADEWKAAKSQFMTFIFCAFVTEKPEAMQELSAHVWEELQKQ